MIAITTSSSISVNPARRCRDWNNDMTHDKSSITWLTRLRKQALSPARMRAVQASLLEHDDGPNGPRGSGPADTKRSHPPRPRETREEAVAFSAQPVTRRNPRAGPSGTSEENRTWALPSAATALAGLDAPGVADGGGSLASSACPPGSPPHPSQTPNANARRTRRPALLDRTAMSLCDPRWPGTTRKSVDPSFIEIGRHDSTRMRSSLASAGRGSPPGSLSCLDADVRIHSA